MPQEKVERQAKRLRVCSICHKTFKRTEHCVRHERAHFRERPFSCRFCERSYGRKDLLVRHERTLHAEAWAKAQESMKAGGDACTRPGRRRQTRNSWYKDGNQQLPNKADSQCGVRINDETVIQFTSFLLSPRVSSSSEASDHEPVNGEAEQFEFNFALDPSLTNAIHATSEEAGAHGHSQAIPTAYSFEQRPVTYDTQMQTNTSNSFSRGEHVPVDPNLTRTAPGTEELSQQCHSSESDTLNFFSLLPGSEVDHTAFSNHLVGLQSQASTPESLGLVAPQAQWLQRSQSGEQQTSASPPTASNRISDPRASHDRLPRLLKERKTSPPRIIVSDDARKTLIADLKERLSPTDLPMDIPSSQSLQRFLGQFFKGFNSHLPIFHIPSFNVAKVPGPLLLAMCSIGALFHLERNTATHLRELANEALHRTHLKRSNRSPAEARPLWEVQCKLLIIAEAAFGGDCAAVSWALENIGIFHREYSLRRTALSSTTTSSNSMNWAAWIERESSKRLLYGIFIISSLLTIAYNVSPCVSTTDDLKIEMPEEERVWTAPDEERWKEAMAARTAVTGLDINQALTQLIFGKEFNLGSESRWPAFATTIIMHAVNIHMWHVTQCTQSFMNFSVDPKMEEQMKALCTAQTEESLARCHRVLTRDRSPEAGYTWDDVEGPLVFNGMALLRSCYVRAFTGSGTFNRTMLFNNDDDDIIRAAKDYVQVQQVRTPFLTRAVAQVFAGLLTPIRAGHLLIRKTAAFTWSIEHAIAAWDCALFYTKWVHTIEMQQHYAPPDEAEKTNLDNLVELLREIDDAGTGSNSLAADVTRTWATFLDDTWTWEVTWRMGKVLRKLADVYENDRKMSQILV
ncbi:hypothetical protein VTN77DRAFT_8645 [Rasamsonia byssochlamydoides]|uniref:uncharacterized protein n=1 Tax=Rasamsonia byssochlamydoides TaxID=89139 RepID=UPI0037442EA5